MGSEILTNHPSTNQPSNRLTDVQKGSWGSFTFNKLKYIHIYVQKMPSKAISRLYQGLWYHFFISHSYHLFLFTCSFLAVNCSLAVQSCCTWSPGCTPHILYCSPEASSSDPFMEPRIYRRTMVEIPLSSRQGRKGRWLQISIIDFSFDKHRMLVSTEILDSTVQSLCVVRISIHLSSIP